MNKCRDVEPWNQKHVFVWIIHENSKYFIPIGTTTQLEWKFIKACRENTYLSSCPKWPVTGF